MLDVATHDADHDRHERDQEDVDEVGVQVTRERDEIHRSPTGKARG
jgi:hypothetical protein